MNRVQKSVIGAAALGALSFAGAALAADLPVKAAPMYAPAPIYSWTGFYLGGHVGAGWGTTETTLDVGNTFIGAPVSQTVNQLISGTLGLQLPIAQTQMNGFLGGLQTGYNWQSGVFVFGVEGDITWSGIKGNSPCVLVFNCTSEVRWIADITGRLGVTVGDRGLVYIKGGAAWADSRVGINQSVTVTTGPFTAFGGVSGSETNTRFGGTLGTGIEYGFMPGWSVKVEYDYYDFGKKDVVVPITASGGISGPNIRGPVTGSIGILAPVNVNEQVHTIRAGVNYHFNTPVVAKY